MKPGGLLVVTAHPDDEVLIAGGVLAACAAAGVPTGVVCFTRGELGDVADASLLTGGRTLGEVRLDELRAACSTLGVDWLRCFRRRDGELPWAPQAELAAQLARLMRQTRPAAVVTFGDDGLYYHHDHLAVSTITRRAVATLRRERRAPLLYESVWPTATSVALVAALHRRRLPAGLWDLPPEDFGTDDTRGSFSVDVSAFVATKLRALRCHRTQLAATNAFTALPADLARRYFGVECFRARPRRAHAEDWLLRASGRRADA